MKNESMGVEDLYLAPEDTKESDSVVLSDTIEDEAPEFIPAEEASGKCKDLPGRLSHTVQRKLRLSIYAQGWQNHCHRDRFECGKPRLRHERKFFNAQLHLRQGGQSGNCQQRYFPALQVLLRRSEPPQA